MDRAERAALRSEGEATRKARQDRDDGCTPAQVRELRDQAAKSASVCADCFQPLSPSASVTMVWRTVTIPEQAETGWKPIPEHEEERRVPICLPCWLINLQSAAGEWASQGWGGDQHDNEARRIEEIKRLRCLSCGRPLRLYHPHHYLRDLPHSERVCCQDCRRKMRNESNRLRRRVEHAKVRCLVCRKTFVQKRSDAQTCSNRCRQKLFRQEHRA